MGRGIANDQGLTAQKRGEEHEDGAFTQGILEGRGRGNRRNDVKRTHG